MLPTLATLVGNFADSAALRAQSPAGLTAQHVATVVQTSPAGRAFVRYAPGSLDADNPPTVWKPDAILSGNPGRWLLLDWVELAGEQDKGIIIQGIALPNNAPPNANGAVRLGLEWQPLCVTQDGTSRMAWFYRTVQLP